MPHMIRLHVRTVFGLLAALVLASGVAGQTRPAPPASSTPSAPSTRPTTAPVRPSPELLAEWEKLQALRADAVKLAREVEKGEKMERARANRRELIALTREFNARLKPIAEASPVRYTGAAGPKAGIPRAVWLYKAARAIEAYNAAADMSESELGVFRVVNEYREALGLVAFEFDLRLRDAAREHSRWMRETGNFTHDSELPGLKNLSDRIDRQGYKWRSCAENLAKGQETSQEAFDGWFESPDHHRNLVGDYVHLGVGRDGELWTQNFASGEPALAGRARK